MKLRSAILVLLSLAGMVPAFAAMEFPPELKTREDFLAYAEKIRVLIPETVTSKKRLEYPYLRTNEGKGLEAYLTMEQKLISDLKSDPAYMTMAQARPPLQTFTLRKLAIRQQTGYGVTAVWKRLLLERNVVPTDDLEAQIEAAAKTSSTLIFSGLSRFLPNDRRSALGQADLGERWKALEPFVSAIAPAELRARFDLHRFWEAAPAEWTLRDLEHLIQTVDMRELEVALQIQVAVMRRQGLNTPTWFASPTQMDAVMNLDLNGNTLKPRLKGFVDALGRRLAKLYMSEAATVEIEEVKRELLLRELPPHVAIYRGCIGIDCSTSHSWSMPYSPLERDWWVEDPNTGERLGYVSGTITKLNGQPCLYIRDITGPEIRAEDITTILKGFYLARASYGAQFLTLAPRSFAAENHQALLVEVLKNFPGKAIVDQTFDDNWIREKYLGPSSGLQYDSVEKHAKVRLLEFVPGELRTVNLKFESQAAPPITDFWELLALAVNTGESYVLEQTQDRAVNWTRLVGILRNENHKLVSEYQRMVEEALAGAGLHFSRNLQRKYENIFMLGFLACPDAFNEEVNIKQAVRYIQEMLWRSPQPSVALPYLQQHLEIFVKSDSMRRLVQGMFERRQPADLERFKVLAQSHYPLHEFVLSSEDALWLIDNLKQPYLTADFFNRANASAAGALPRGSNSLFRPRLHMLAPLLRNDHEDEFIAEVAAQALWLYANPLAITAVAEEVTDSLREEENVKIRFYLAALLLREGRTAGEAGVDAYRTLRQLANDESISEEWREHGRMALAGLDLVESNRLERRSDLKDQGELDSCEEVLKYPHR